MMPNIKPAGPPRILDTAYPEKSQRDRWLLSYADYMTLLLALFVVLYASARLEVERAGTVKEGILEAFDHSVESPLEAQIETPALIADDSNPAPLPSLEKLEEQILEALRSRPEGSPLDDGIQVERNRRGLVVRLASAEFFPEGGVQIPPERKAVLRALAPFLAARPHPLRFEGHTDNQPMSGDAYPSNWELSSARASAVARFFAEQPGIDPRRIAVSGFSEHQPIADNGDPVKRAQNRRVEIVVLENADLLPVVTTPPAQEDFRQLLQALPPLPEEADERLRPRPPGPAPSGLPLP